MNRLFHRLRRSRFPLLALGCLVLLLLAGVGIAVFNEQAARRQLAHEAEAQADLLASAVSGALAFEDSQAAQDYIDAVQVNPSVVSAAVYDEGGRQIAAFVRAGETSPSELAERTASTRFEAGRLTVVRPVTEGGQHLGAARLSLLDTPPAQTVARYAAYLLILALAALVVGVLAVAQGALRRANRDLAQRAAALAAANAQLEHQMAEREKAEEALRQSQKMEAIGRLTGGIAHDFNNLLMVASSGVELMERTDDPKRRKALSDGVRQAVERGAALTRQLLAFSRRSPLKTEVIALKDRIEGLSMLLERSLREDIEVRFDLPEDLWPVEADPGELELALLNLAVNARDAMPGGGRLLISARNRPGSGGGPGGVSLVVADTGVGMAPGVAARIFEPFFTTKEVGRGTGLGLSQVYGFARSSGGTISVVSAEGEGAAFTLFLPRTDRPATSGPPRPAADAAAGGGQGRRVLLVEDDDAVAAGVGHMLRDLDYVYVRSESAASALTALERAEAFDIILSDMIMPGGMDGLTLAQEVRRRWPGTPIVLMTGFSEAAAAAGEAGLTVLNKPYGVAELARVLETALTQHAI
jgi:signal transduction histidine kinase